jgi:4-carboxymuconolactone decarboxylase
MEDFAPKLCELLFGGVCARPDLSPWNCGLVTISVLIAMNWPDQLRSHLLQALPRVRGYDVYIKSVPSVSL